MKGLILIPECYRVYVTDRDKVLFGMIAEKFDFDIEYGRTERVPTDIDIVISVMPRFYVKNENDSMMYLAKLDKNVKLIGYLGDFHSMNRFGNDIKMFDRYDVILSRVDLKFRRNYPQYVDKMVFFPNWFAPHERYASLKFNETPIQKCLLCGRLYEPEYYPLRVYIGKHRDCSKIDVMKHPGGHPKAERLKNKRYYVGDRYAKRLNDYLACVTCAGKVSRNNAEIDGGVVTKYLEIPATGSLLMADDDPDVRAINLIPDVHYIAITKENVFSKIDKVLSNPDAYTEIRRKGREFVLKNHSVNNRFETLVNIIKEL